MTSPESILVKAVSDARERLETAFPGHGTGARELAIGWATVEAERAEAELAGALRAGLGSFEDAPDDLLLGARCRTAPGGPARFMTVLEPRTEGRLAGSLARLGEGPHAVWFTLAALPTAGLSELADGPFGPERLVVGGPRHGQYVFLLADPPGTIAP